MKVMKRKFISIARSLVLQEGGRCSEVGKSASRAIVPAAWATNAQNERTGCRQSLDLIPLGVRAQQTLAQQSEERGDGGFVEQIGEEQRPNTGNDLPSNADNGSSRSQDRAQQKRRAASQDPFLQEITSTFGPAATYKENRLSGAYKKDARQELTIQKLQRLYDDLQSLYKGSKRRSGLTVMDHSGTSSGKNAWWSGISSFIIDGSGDKPIGPKVKGLYMYGGVGTGKTMLMDLLVHSAPPQFQLRRVHFHDFMLEIHSTLRQFHSQADPLLKVANKVAQGVRVLCLDELFVTDVADAAILNRLFSRLWELGLVLVATSNRHPDDLYKGGLQRELFLPFIAKLKEETEVHDMNSAIDYRKLAKHKKGLSFTSEVSQNPDQELTQHFEEMAKSQGGPPEPRTISVQMGRQLNVPLARGELCLMTFDELCRKNLGAADYIALAQTFHTVALRGVPIFKSDLKPEAYRFVTLVDVLYENRIQVLCSAAGNPMDLFQNVLSQDEAKKQGSNVQDDAIVDDNLAFSKDRTVSRLTEMGTKEYLLSHARRHAPCHVLALDEQHKKAQIDQRGSEDVAVAA